MTDGIPGDEHYTSSRSFDDLIGTEATVDDKMGLIKGTITFAPNASAPCHCANCVLLEQEVARLRTGNAELLKANKHLQGRIYDLEGKK